MFFKKKRVAVEKSSQATPVDVNRELQRIAEARSWARGISVKAGKPIVPAATGLPNQLKDLRVAAILDPFSESCFRGTCNLKNLSIDNWESEISEFEPHILFIESAWEGKGKGWRRKVSIASMELQDLIGFCNSRSIPVVFWNKEDPVHFDAFINAARLCDYVFTTDIDCIERYKQRLNHKNVFLLPFGASPNIHNPIEKYERKNKFVFAGAYYPRFGSRKGELDMLLDVSTSTLGVDIYDRELNNLDTKNHFPEEYVNYIVGTLQYSEIDKAYKGYKFGINVNSVKHSQTMFARRLFEQMACNCLTVSGYSRAIRNLFGDLVPCSNDHVYLTRKVNELIDDPSRYNKLRLLGLRKVYSEHLFSHRMEYVLEKVFQKKCSDELPPLTLISDPLTEDQRSKVIRAFRAQTYQNKRLILLVHAAAGEKSSSSIDDGVSMVSGDSMTKLGETVVSGYVGYLSPDDHYGKNYLTDIALATRYSNADVIGKSAQYQHKDGKIQLTMDGSQYQSAESLDPRCSVVSAALVLEQTPAEFISEATKPRKGNKMFSIDEMNYCQNWNENDCPIVDDLILKDPGLSMAMINLAAEKEVIRGSSEPVKELIIDDLSVRFDNVRKQKYSLNRSGKDVVIVSTLSNDEKEYIRFKKAIDVSLITQTDRITASIDVVITGGLDLQVALVCLDEKGNKLGSLFARRGRLLEEKLPLGTKEVWPWLRVSGSGEGSLKRISFGMVRQGYNAWLGHSSTLLISNAYPSYQDLYRNFFVHRRAFEYERENQSLDVFRFTPHDSESFTEFEGIQIITGYKKNLDELLSIGVHKKVLVHHLTPEMWGELEKHVDRLKVIIWIHGSEIQPWQRREFNYDSEEELRRAKEQSNERMAFWKGLFALNHPNVHFVFVSDNFYREVVADLGMELAMERYSIIHNFIDTDLFRYGEKTAEMRKKILSIRSFASPKYANDLTVKAIVELSKSSNFKDMEFRIVGDGKLFNEVTAPLKMFSNVILEQRFLPLEEMVAMYHEYGIFFNPTRWDSQGVSRDEAMSSGLVPVTNNVAAIPEFADSKCAILVAAEDYVGMAKGVEMLYRDPALFRKMSKAARERVEGQSSKQFTIRRELELINSF